MKKLITKTFLIAAILVLGIPVDATEGTREEPATAELAASAQPDGPAIFERLKSLVGEWRGSWKPGALDTQVTYRLTGNGSVVVEEYVLGERSDGSSMATLYHLDGEDLMLTHYCSIGNQPRMRATGVSADGREIVFEQFDITNLGERGYSERLTLTLEDEDHIAVAYRGSRTGNSSGVALERVR